MADKLESALNAASDAAYVRGIDSAGNSIQISKKDLASVVSTVLGVPMGTVSNLPDADLNNVTKNGIYTVHLEYSPATANNNSVGYGVLCVFAGNYTYTIQLLSNSMDGKVYIRCRSNLEWFAWKEL